MKSSKFDNRHFSSIYDVIIILYILFFIIVSWWPIIFSFVIFIFNKPFFWSFYINYRFINLLLNKMIVFFYIFYCKFVISKNNYYKSNYNDLY